MNHKLFNRAAVLQLKNKKIFPILTFNLIHII